MIFAEAASVWQGKQILFFFFSNEQSYYFSAMNNQPTFVCPRRLELHLCGRIRTGHQNIVYNYNGTSLELNS